MDFMVAGTREFVTASPLDMKVTGLPGEVLAGALEQAHDARLIILDVIEDTIPVPREEVNPIAPRILSIHIPVDKIGEVIGPKGTRSNEIIAMTGADIDIQDDGTVFIGSREGAGADEAARMIEEIANPRPVLVGERYTGKVVKTTTFGAFVNLVPGRDGLVHISKLGKGKRLSNVEDAVREGDTLEVEVQEIDGQGKIIRWDHKTVFSILAGGVFAFLLLGRLRFGWRGRKAVRVLYTGSLLLLLAYAGSRFVLEVVLRRPA